MTTLFIPAGSDSERSTTHLDAPETPGMSKPSRLHPPDLDSDGPLVHCFRHSGWRADRERVYAALASAAVPPARRIAFAECGSGHWILRNTSDPEQFRVVPDHCHDRFCVPCSAQRQSIIRRNLAARIGKHPHRFLTLTVRHHDEPLGVLIRHLYRSFRRLRQRAIWKRHVTGGAAFLEVAWSEARQSWHPHLHAMLEGRYIDLQDLKRAWLAATGDSHDVHIRLIRNHVTAIRYVTKYATKPLPPPVVRTPELLEEAIRALQNKRMLITFGTWRKWRLLQDPDRRGWEVFAHLNEVVLRASDGDTLCEAVLAMLKTADVHTGIFFATDPGPPTDAED